MSNKVFHDCLGRQINVGDVLANGHRVGSCHASITLGVVTGFTDGKILAKKLQRGYWFEDSDGKRSWCGYGGDSWRFYNGYWCDDEQRCCITGLTEDALKAMINLESDEKR